MENDISFDDWSLVINGGQAWVGKHHAGLDGDALSPVLELKSALVMRDGQACVAMQCFPPLMLASLVALPIPGNSTITPLSRLSAEDRRQVTEAIRKGMQFVAHLRAAQSGIALAPVMPKGLVGR